MTNDLSGVESGFQLSSIGLPPDAAGHPAQRGSAASGEIVPLEAWRRAVGRLRGYQADTRTAWAITEDVMLGWMAVIALWAGQAEAPPILWRDVRAGMSTADFEALHPAVQGSVTHRASYASLKQAQPIGRCQADVEVYHPRGTVTKVIVRSRGHGLLRVKCGDDVEPALIAKYGEPTTRDVRAFTWGVENEDRTFTWRAGNVLVRLERKSVNTDDDWTIEYTPIVDIGL